MRFPNEGAAHRDEIGRLHHNENTSIRWFPRRRLGIHEYHFHVWGWHCDDAMIVCFVVMGDRSEKYLKPTDAWF
jgi:hypothetical protein